ncbi:hypothetical protein GBL97_18370 [Yersinia pseudotuberculosis]|nr:DNA adenine methylase [Yersinia pseudotuberculosis]MBO1567605.1 hypothetical protein [Yersinia pseudotuberculosis]MBO1604464.1 hypothetical protein [Yersinia pseudotuberculosis]
MSTQIIPWVGGKRRSAKHILPLFPAHTCYIEPFCGGAALYTQMAQLARSIKGSMIISVNDIPEMRDVFKGLHMDTVSLKYSLGDNKKQVSELIIRNF